MNPELFDKYCQFLRVIMGRIDDHFENQKEYIHCKEGCAYCCKNGEYPCSELEFEFLKIGFMTIDKDLQQLIINKVLKLKAEKDNCKDKKFIYECPFLINDRCSIYKYRMIICRTFGLPYYEDNKEKGEKNVLKIPFCMYQGLNYSDVYDKKTDKLSDELFKKGGYKNEPLAYNLSLEFLMERFGKEIMNLDFGDEKPLIDWL